MFDIKQTMHAQVQVLTQIDIQHLSLILGHRCRLLVPKNVKMHSSIPSIK